jgi:hypothetical protein
MRLLSGHRFAIDERSESLYVLALPACRLVDLEVIRLIVGEACLACLLNVSRQPIIAGSAFHGLIHGFLKVDITTLVPALV